MRPLHVLLRHPSALLTLVFLRLNFDVSLASDWSVKTTSFSIEFKLIPSTYHILSKRAKLRSLASATGYKYWPLPLLPTFLLHPHTSTFDNPIDQQPPSHTSLKSFIKPSTMARTKQTARKVSIILSIFSSPSCSSRSHFCDRAVMHWVGACNLQLHHNKP